MPPRSPTLTNSYASNACTTISSPRDPSRKVLVDDEELLSRVHEVRGAMALKKAITDPVDSWDTIKRTSCLRLGSSLGRETFELSSRATSINRGGYEVMTVGCIACSPQELVSILSSSDETEYNAAMKGLYGRKFIYGSVVQTRHANQLKGSVSDGDQLTIKTGCFARSRILAHNEQWCYLEYFQPTRESMAPNAMDTVHGFSITLLSLSENELAMGKAIGGRVDQIDGITALLVVDTVPAVSKDVSDGKATKLRVIFHALYNRHNESGAGHASDKMARARLMALAQGIPRLPAVVRRRRLGMQVFANQSVEVPMPKAKAKNWRCISCTKGLHLNVLIRCVRRCQLCAYNVCTSCWSRENIEANNGLVVTMGVCNRCLEWVDRCDYSCVQANHRGTTVQIIEDPDPSEASLRRPPVGQSLRDELAVESTKDAAVTVIRMLLSYSKTAANALYTSEPKHAGIDVDDEETYYMSAVEEYFQRRASEAPAAADCVLANATQRSYPLHPMDAGSPSAPIPENEGVRLQCIDSFKYMDIKDPMPELDIICSFLSKELGFFCTMITIVGATHQLVLSCTVRELVQAMLPREHTFCQHLLMGNAPFIIRNPEADIRFYNLNPVTLQGVKYYCGIPIVGPDGIMVGSICCVHSSAMEITRSQYDTLVRFGEIASKIIRVKAETKLQSL